MAKWEVPSGRAKDIHIGAETSFLRYSILLQTIRFGISLSACKEARIQSNTLVIYAQILQKQAAGHSITLIECFYIDIFHHFQRAVPIDFEPNHSKFRVQQRNNRSTNLLPPQRISSQSISLSPQIFRLGRTALENQ